MSTLTHEREPAAWLKEARPEAPSLPIEKAPQLNASLERFAEGLGDALAPFCGEGANGKTERIATTTTFELFDAYNGRMAAVLRSNALESRAVMIFDETAIDVLLDSIFGVDLGVAAAGADAEKPARTSTELETQILAGYARTLAANICDAFAPVASFDLTVESMHPIVDVNLLGPREMAAIMAQYAIKMRGGTLKLVVALPQTLTTPLGEMFARGPDPNAAKIDPQWARRMEQGVGKAKLTLTAILDQFQMTLGDISSLAVGSTLPLGNSGDAHIRIESVERGIFLCRLGEKGDRYALEIEDIIANNSDAEYDVAP